jgi:hypothetical protein
MRFFRLVNAIGDSFSGWAAAVPLGRRGAFTQNTNVAGE